MVHFNELLAKQLQLKQPDSGRRAAKVSVMEVGEGEVHEPDKTAHTQGETCLLYTSDAADDM
eukprot:4443257-Alexandrium_andersonii.AAC.1